MKLPWRRKPQPKAVIGRDLRTGRYYIHVYGQKAPRVLTMAAWRNCPGSIHEDYPTKAEAELVARWWGYQL